MKIREKKVIYEAKKGLKIKSTRLTLELGLLTSRTGL